MISFIIIGRNIQNTIELCLNSIMKFIDKNYIVEFEIIYVDSDSSDNTLELVSHYPVRIFLLRGDVNAAVGRNVGAKYAKGEILFFIDGDMEIIPDFYSHVFNTNTNQLKYSFNSGYLIHKYYDSNFNYLYSKNEDIPSKPVYKSVTGGLIIIEKEYWDKVGGMDERLIRHQDLDLGFRLSKIGIYAQLSNHLFAIHHTVSYTNKSRIFNFFLSKALLSSGLLMRKHIFNYAYLRRHYLNVLNVFLLMCFLLAIFISKLTSGLFIILYITVQLFRSLNNQEKRKKFFNEFLFKMFFNIYSLIGILFYYPNRPNYKTTEIEINNRKFNNE